MNNVRTTIKIKGPVIKILYGALVRNIYMRFNMKKPRNMDAYRESINYLKPKGGPETKETNM